MGYFSTKITKALWSSSAGDTCIWSDKSWPLALLSAAFSMALYWYSNGDLALRQRCILPLVPTFPGQGIQQCPALQNCTFPFASLHMPDCCAGLAGASAAASCKKRAKIVEPESNCTMSTKLAKAVFWEGSGFC